jgi:hypothetical protein
VVRVSLSGPRTTYALYLVPESEPMSAHDARDMAPVDLRRRRAGTTIHEWLAATERDPTNAFGEVAEALGTYALRHRNWWYARTPVGCRVVAVVGDRPRERVERAPSLVGREPQRVHQRARRAGRVRARVEGLHHDVVALHEGRLACAPG